MSLDHCVRFFAAFTANTLLAIAVFVGLSLYEWGALGERPLAESLPPHTTAYYIARSGLAFLLSLAIIADLYRRRDLTALHQLGAIPRKQLLIAWSVLATAVAFTVVFAADPVLFNTIGKEDGPIEWSCAALPLISSALLIYGFRMAWRAKERGARRTLTLLLTSSFALALFVLGMEEISWMQRIFDIETPAMFEGNWQNEMNLHNMSSRAIGSVLMLASFAWLILLPFVYETGPKARLLEVISDFIPSRFVVAVTAPMAAFNYNTWNFFPTQMTMMMTALIVLFYAWIAWVRQARAEALLFATLAAFIIAAQATFLVLGDSFVRLWDVTEYLEFYLVLGFIFFAWETTMRLRARYAPSV